MRMISAIMNFYWSHAIALQKLSNERSYKFSLISTLTEVISIIILRVQSWSKMYFEIILSELTRNHKRQKNDANLLAF